MTITQHAEEIAREFRASTANNAGTFIRLCRRMGKIPGVSNVQALEMAKEVFPGSYADYVKRQNKGETMAPLFPKPEASTFQQRRAAAVRRGGCIN